MKKGKNRCCLNCLHCKVSAKSTANCRLCYCAETENKARHKEKYWQDREVCACFEDMSA